MDNKIEALAKKCLARAHVQPIFPYKTVKVANAIETDDGLMVLLEDGRKMTFENYPDMAAKEDRLAKMASTTKSSDASGNKPKKK